MSLNPGPLTLGVLNARSGRNKGPLLANIVISNDLDFLYLIETHFYASNSEFLWSITPLHIFSKASPLKYWWWCWFLQLDPPTNHIK